MNQEGPSQDTVRAELQKLLSELDRIRAEAISRGEWDLGWERLERWRQRVFQFLCKHVSEKEAAAFIPSPDPWTDLGDAIDASKGFLVVLAEELQTRPETVIKRAAIPTKIVVAENGGRQVESPAGSTLKKPEIVTLKWIWEHVGWQMYTGVISALIAAFIAGAYLSSVPGLRPFFNLLPGYSRLPRPTLPSDKAEQFIQEFKDLEAGHNQRLADLQKDLLLEERLAGDHTLVSWQRETHRNAADKIRELIDRENGSFQRKVEAFKRFYE